MEYSTIDFTTTDTMLLINACVKGELQISKRQLSELHEKTIAAVKQARFVESLNCLMAGIMLNDTATFDMIRRKGLFRYSNYIETKCIVPDLCVKMLSLLKQQQYAGQENLNYLAHAITLAPTLKTLKNLRVEILQEFRWFNSNFPGYSLVKSLMAFVDFLFLEDHYPTEQIRTDLISGRSKEDIASSVSYLIFSYCQTHQLSVRDAARVEENYVLKGRIMKLIIASCYVGDIKDLEIKVEHFSYAVIKTPGSLLFVAPSEAFEKSIHLGFIRSELQYGNDKIAMAGDLSEDAVSIEDLANEILGNKEFDVFKFRDDPRYYRYALELQPELMAVIVEQFIKPDTFFKHEYYYLSHAFKEQLLDFEQVKSIKIRGNLTILEFLKIQRFFILINFLFSRQLNENEKVLPQHMINSLIPSLTEDQVYDMLGMLTEEEHITDFLDIITWEPADAKLFDIQYHPFVFIEGFYLMSLTLFAESNILRNLYASEYKSSNVNLMTNGTKDPLAERLKDAFQQIQVNSDSGINYQGLTDIDFIARMDDTLIIFECKQSILPTSIHDLRTSFDYIKKAEKQLKILKDDFEAGTLIQNIAHKTTLDLTNIKELITGIIISNRLFIGNVFTYPVRNVHELHNFITSGTIKTNEGEFLIWRGTAFSLADLKDYLYNNKLFQLLFDTIEPQTLEYALKPLHLKERTYYLHIEKARASIKVLTANYAPVTDAAN
jgi:hypothetical protein